MPRAGASGAPSEAEGDPGEAARVAAAVAAAGEDADGCFELSTSSQARPEGQSPLRWDLGLQGMRDRMCLANRTVKRRPDCPG